jgi:hypothetical protein
MKYMSFYKTHYAYFTLCFASLILCNIYLKVILPSTVMMLHFGNAYSLVYLDVVGRGQQVY